MWQDDKQLFQFFRPFHSVSLCNLLYNFQKTSDKIHHPKNEAAFVGAFAKLRKATISFVISFRLSACPSAWNNLASTGRILIKLYIHAFLRKSVEKIQVLLKSKKNSGYVT
jgi:hypothetical protein